MDKTEKQVGADRDKMVARTSRVIVSILSPYPDSYREEVMQLVFQKYCRHCWRETKGETCHCTNDE